MTPGCSAGRVGRQHGGVQVQVLPLRPVEHHLHGRLPARGVRQHAVGRQVRLRHHRDVGGPARERIRQVRVNLVVLVYTLV